MLEKNGANIDKELREYRKSLFADLSGTVLEIGPGTGDNFAYYPAGITWIGIEPNTYMSRYLTKKAQEFGFKVDLRTGFAEKIDAPDSSVDTVVCTHVLCSVNDPPGAISEVLRVLKPGGKLLFLEHVAAEKGTVLRIVQRFIRPFWKIVADGCCPDRETVSLLEKSGFDKVTSEKFRMKPVSICPVSPHVYGIAVKKK